MEGPLPTNGTNMEITKSARVNRLTFVRNRSLGIFVITLLLFLAFGAGTQYGQKRAPQQNTSQIPATISANEVKNGQPTGRAKEVDFALFWQVWDMLPQLYIDKTAVDSQKMLYGAISGMVSSLGDPYTTFLPPEENKMVKDELGGNFDGVGIELGYKENQLVVIAPLDDTPASKAGVLAGDYIIKIDNQETAGVTLPEAVKKIRGQKGTAVALELYRQGQEKTFTVQLTRQTIHVKSVTFSLKENNIGYFKLSRFGDETNNEWDVAVRQAQAATIKAAVVDVRNNPGGYLQSAIYVGSEFINGVIMKQEKSDGSKQTFEADRNGKLLKVPVVVLINKGSASASEILAGAILANNRGKLVGEKSFGKGTIQEVQPLDKGAGIHVTRARWLLPNDFWVHGKGLQPQVEASMSADDIKAGRDPQLEKALEVAKQAIR